MFRGHDHWHVWALVRIVVFYQLHIEVWDASSISFCHGLETCIFIEVYIVMLILMDSRRVYLTFVGSNCRGPRRFSLVVSLFFEIMLYPEPLPRKRTEPFGVVSGLLHIIRYRTGSGILLSKKNTCETCSSYAFSSLRQMDQKSCFVSQVNSPLRFQHMIRLILPTKKAGYRLGIGAKYHSVSCGSQWCQGCRGLERAWASGGENRCWVLGCLPKIWVLVTRFLYVCCFLKTLRRRIQYSFYYSKQIMRSVVTQKESSTDPLLQLIYARLKTYL